MKQRFWQRCEREAPGKAISWIRYSLYLLCWVMAFGLGYAAVIYAYELMSRLPPFLRPLYVTMYSFPQSILAVAILMAITAWYALRKTLERPSEGGILVSSGLVALSVFAVLVFILYWTRSGDCGCTRAGGGNPTTSKETDERNGQLECCYLRCDALRTAKAANYCEENSDCISVAFTYDSMPVNRTLASRVKKSYLKYEENPCFTPEIVGYPPFEDGHVATSCVDTKCVLEK